MFFQYPFCGFLGLSFSFAETDVAGSYEGVYAVSMGEDADETDGVSVLSKVSSGVYTLTIEDLMYVSFVLNFDIEDVLATEEDGKVLLSKEDPFDVVLDGGMTASVTFVGGEVIGDILNYQLSIFISLFGITVNASFNTNSIETSILLPAENTEIYVMNDVLKVPFVKELSAYYIYDLSGSLQKKGFCLEQILIDDLKSGVYFVNINNFSAKFIKP